MTVAARQGRYASLDKFTTTTAQPLVIPMGLCHAEIALTTEAALSIYALVNEIEQGNLVLPAIQRDFVWSEKQIETLLDSVFRGYPVGIVLLWETYTSIQIRHFEKAHNPKQIYEFFENKPGQRIRLVLDGQQRLSSLYVALRGTYSTKRLYFNVLSGRDSDNQADLKFRFLFAEDTEIVEKNTAPPQTTPNKKNLEYWVLLRDLIGKSPREITSFRTKLGEKMLLNADDALLLDINLQTANFALTNDGEILKTQTIDANLPAEDEKRKTAFDILEIFVRINTQGTTLRRSDLIVSMLRLYWQESSSVLPKFIKEINEGNNLDIDNDFVIRCMFATAGIGTRLDFDLLRRKSNVEIIKSTYRQCFEAIKLTIDFLKSDCGIDSAKLIGGMSTLVPFVFYFYQTGGKSFDLNSRKKAKQSLLIFAFSKVLTQHVDSRSGSFLRDYMPPKEHLTHFPLDGVIKYVNWHTAIAAPDNRLFGTNVELALSIIQNKNGGKMKHLLNQPEIDHIFPKSELYNKNYEVSDINSLGNFWIIPLSVNRNKSAKHPAKYFEGVDHNFLKDALIDKDKLDYRQFRSFIRDREQQIVSKIIDITGITNDLFASALL